MSKSNPPSPPPPAPAREFRFQQFREGTGPPQPAFQFLWPDLKGPKSSSRFEQHLEEVETKILKQSKEKLLLLEKEAYEKGFAQGEKDGRELGQKKNEMIMQQMKNLLAEMERQKSALYRSYGREMIQLILKVARQVVHREALSQEDVLLANLERAMQKAVERKNIIVRLNPADSQYLQGHPELNAFARDADRGVKMVEDPSIQRGGCLLQTSFGEIDATIENQIDQVASLIWKIFEESGLPLPSAP